MQDHGLFQAICRTNRLDGEDKDFGYIVDYKDLFTKVEKAIAVYTSELDHSSEGAAPEILLQDRLKRGRERLDDTIEALALLCETDEPRRISPFDNMGLLDIIVKTGITDAIDSQLGGLKGDQKAIAETIENNVRSKIIKEHLNDPVFYEKMSRLLDEIIKDRKARAMNYEEYLKQIGELAKNVGVGHFKYILKTDQNPPL
jgi:type I site-specific restriction-modification system R (restriction) subunit